MNNKIIGNKVMCSLIVMFCLSLVINAQYWLEIEKDSNNIRYSIITKTFLPKENDIKIVKEGNVISFGKSVFLANGYKYNNYLNYNYYVISKFEIYCSDNKARVLAKELYDDNDVFLIRDDKPERWIKGTTTNIIGSALKYWCPQRVPNEDLVSVVDILSYK